VHEVWSRAKARSRMESKMSDAKFEFDEDKFFHEFAENVCEAVSEDHVAGARKTAQRLRGWKRNFNSQRRSIRER
jgi:hypothetical protein